MLEVVALEETVVSHSHSPQSYLTSERKVNLLELLVPAAASYQKEAAAENHRWNSSDEACLEMS